MRDCTIPFAMLAAVPDLVSTDVRTILRGDLIAVVLGILLLALGFAAAAIHRLRSQAKDPALLYFGLFAGLYGLRLLCGTRIVPFLAEPLPRDFWAYLQAVITYTIAIPGLLAFYELVPTSRGLLRWLLRLQIAFGIAGIVTDQILRRPLSLSLANNIIVVCSVVPFAIGLLRHRRSTSTRAIRLGVLIFIFTAFLGNLRGLGVLHLGFDPEPIGFAIFLGFLGTVVARRAVENEDRLLSIEKELEIARRIQTSILPREMPKLAGLAIAARYLPMTSVAGDFYDFLIVDDRRIGVLIADVSGHGVPAALIASMVKVAVASQLEHAADPVRVLTGMNQILCGKMQGQFVTAAYLYLDLTAGSMRYSAAGHPPLLWWSRNGQPVQSLEENGMVLGFMAGAPYTCAERPIHGGDRFVLYTDGLLEATDGTEEFFGEHRLKEAIAGTVEFDVEKASQALLDRLATWTRHAPQEDDLTVVVIDIHKAGTTHEILN